MQVRTAETSLKEPSIGEEKRVMEDLQEEQEEEQEEEEQEGRMMKEISRNEETDCLLRGQGGLECENSV